MKKRIFLPKKMELFYNDIDKKKLQIVQEFNQRKIEELNKKLDVEMYSTHLRGGKAFAAEQKIRELKQLLLRSKRIEKFKGKCIKPKKLIKSNF